MKIKQSLSYQEGYWAGKSVAENIERTTYKSVENAVKVKQKLIDRFESDFKYTAENWNDDSNYSYNLGLLDKLKEYLS